MLQGFQLLDLSRLLPGPLCSLILADMGMEVIRIEPPGQLGKGDLFREIPAEETPYFSMLNRGKKSVTLNLKASEGKDLFFRMVQRADVVLEGFRPGVMTRLGLDWETLSSINPRLVMASISGYGQKGPYRERAGHDLNYIAYAGILGLNGPAADSIPVVPPVQIADIGGGSQQAAIGILAALIERQRTGTGRWLDISMMEGSLPWMALAMFDRAVGKPVAKGIPPIAWGSANYNVYETKEGGYVALGALERNFWELFCQEIGKPAWGKLYDTPEELRSEEFVQSLRDIFLEKTRREWVEMFGEKDVCLSPVYTPEEVMEDKHIRNGKTLEWMTLPGGTKIPRINFPFGRVDGERAERSGKSPELGQHSDDFYRDTLGLTEDQIQILRRGGVI